MDEILDLFADDGFSATSLTATINTLPYVPGFLGQLGIFGEAGLTTTTLNTEEVAGTIGLIPNTPRGGVSPVNKHDRRTLRNFTVPHFPLEDAVRAHEIQNIRQAGSMALETAQAVINQKMNRMVRTHDAMLEYGRIGAVTGKILDSDGTTVIYNLFTEFGVSQTTQDYTLGTSATNILGLTTDMKGVIEDALGGLPYDTVMVLAGKTFWKKFISHSAVTTAYQYFQSTGQNMNPLREDLRYRGFVFGDAIWRQYRGKVGSVSFIADSEAYMFPIGVPDLFITRFAPADFLDMANQPGVPRVARLSMDPDGRYIKLLTESNPISLCTRPATLIKLTTSN